MRRPHVRDCIIALILASVPSCADKSGARAWRGSMETADGVTIVANPEAPIYDLGAVELAEELSFGDAPGIKAPVFWQAWYVAVNDRGEIFVMDAGDAGVKVFGPDGAYVRSVGRRGQGPGELQNPNSLFVLRDGRLVFEDFIRGLNVFGADGTFLTFLPATGFVDVLVSPGGRIVARVNTLEADRPAKQIRVFDNDLRPQAAFRLVPDPPRDPQAVKWFAGGFHWTLLGEDALALSEGSPYEIEVFSLDGRLRRRIRKDQEPVKVTQEEIEAVQKRLRGRRVEFAPVHAAIQGLWSDDEGRLIVQTYERTVDGRSFCYDIFDREGRCLAKLAVPENVRPQVWQGGKMYGLEEDVEGNQKVKRYRLVWRVPR